MIKVSLIFGIGNLNIGFNNIIARISHQNDSISQQYHGSLPFCESIIELQKRWQFLYQALLGRFIRGKFEIDETEGFTPNISISNLEKTASEIAKNLNNWLASDSFREIDRTLLQLSKNEPIRLTIETEDSQLIRLPWHLWRFCQDNPLIGVGFSPLNRHGVNISNSQTVKILGILGDSTGIDLEGDRTSLQSTIKQYQNTELKFLQEPSRQQFNEQLWDEKWDILFFAGHSKSNSISGEIAINPHETITIEQLKHSLKRAIQQGLKLAIFNSCDGLGLANALADLQLPQIIVMQEDVPNEVAQQFIKYFLKSLTEGKTIEIAKREAQEKLQGLEGKYAGASWLPILFQHPDNNWHPFSIIKPESEAVNWLNICREEISKQKNLTSNPLTLNEERFNLDDIFVPLGLLERKKKDKKDKKSGAVDAEKGSTLYNSGNKFSTVATDSENNHNDRQRQEETEEITREYSHEEFFSEVLAKGESPKSNGKRIAIIGEPGAGKTTQLQKIADGVLNQNQIPVWVSLADLQRKTIEEYLLQIWLKDALKVARVTPEQENELVELFNQGQVWLLLDGVDEMGETNPLAEINHQLRGWLTSAKIVITCRVNVWDAGKNYLQEFDIYRNLDVSEELREEFVNKWFSHQPDLAESLESALNQTGKERIKDLVRNPLRLTLLCSFWQRRQGDLPETKAGLYQQFVKVFYEWKEEYFTTTAKQRRELNQALGILAREAIDKSNSRFRLTHSEVCQYLGDEDSELFNLAIDLGWLNQVGVAAENPDEVVYAFYHPTFQEYFTALTIDDWHFFLTHIPDNPSEGIYRIFEPQWKEVYLLWLGRNDINDEQKEELIEALYNFNDNCGDFYFFRSFLLTSAGVGEFKDSKLTDEIMEELIKLSFGYFDEERKQWISYIESIKKDARIYLAQISNEIIFNKICNLLVKIESNQDIKSTFDSSQLNSLKNQIISKIEEIANKSKLLASQVLAFLVKRQDWLSFRKIVNLPLIPFTYSSKNYLQKINISKKYWKSIINQDIKNNLNRIINQENNDIDQSTKLEIIFFLFFLDYYDDENINYLVNSIKNNNNNSLYCLHCLTNFESYFNNLLQKLAEELINNHTNFSNYELVATIYKNLSQFNSDNNKLLDYLNKIIDNCQDSNIVVKVCEDLSEIDYDNQKANNILVSMIIKKPDTIKIESYILEGILSDIPFTDLDYYDKLYVDLDKITSLNSQQIIELEELLQSLNNEFYDSAEKDVYKLFSLAYLILRFSRKNKKVIDILSYFIENTDQYDDYIEPILSAIYILDKADIFLNNKNLLVKSVMSLQAIGLNSLGMFDIREFKQNLINKYILSDARDVKEIENNIIDLFLQLSNKYSMNLSLSYLYEVVSLFLKKYKPSFIILSFVKNLTLLQINNEQNNLSLEKSWFTYLSKLKLFHAHMLLESEETNKSEAIYLLKELLNKSIDYNIFLTNLSEILLQKEILIEEYLTKLEQILIINLDGIIQNNNYQNIDTITQIIKILYKYNVQDKLNNQIFQECINQCLYLSNVSEKTLRLAETIIQNEPNNIHLIEYFTEILIKPDNYFDIEIYEVFSSKGRLYFSSEEFEVYEKNFLPHNLIESNSGELATSSLIKANLKDSLNFVISKLKNCLFYKLKNYEKNNINCINMVNEVFWYCANNSKYHEFYQAWHSQPNIHPEMQ